MTPSPNPDVKAVVDSNEEFTFQFLFTLERMDRRGGAAGGNKGDSPPPNKKQKKEDDNLLYSQNFFSSPFSIQFLFAQLQMGTKGGTYKKIRDVFKYPKNLKALRDGYKGILESLRSAYCTTNDNNTKGSQLSFANSLFLHSSYKIEPSYAQTLKKYFPPGGELQQLDFFVDPSTSAETINNWVGKNTLEKIKKVVTPTDLKNGSLVLINAIYFKGLWKYGFDKKDTKKAPFYLDDGKVVQVDMMTTRLRTLYLNFGGMHTIALPYVGDRLLMLIASTTTKKDQGTQGSQGAQGTPKKGFTSFDEQSFFQKVNPAITDFMNFKDPQGPNSSNDKDFQEVILTLPKFKMETTLNLTPVLGGMGLPLGDTDNFNFPGILEKGGNEGLSHPFLSYAVQKALIEVDEEGASTSPIKGVSSRSQKVVRFDHPFMYQIVDKETGFLFSGRCGDPTK